MEHFIDRDQGDVVTSGHLISVYGIFPKPDETLSYSAIKETQRMERYILLEPMKVKCSSCSKIIDPKGIESFYCGKCKEKRKKQLFAYLKSCIAPTSLAKKMRIEIDT